MKGHDSNPQLLSGRIGNLIYYVRGGKQCIRRVAIPGKKKKTEERTPRQKAVSGRFTIVQTFYATYSEYISPDIWRIAARQEGRIASNLFHSVNCRCFSGEGKLLDFEKFLFTQGRLLLPRNIRVERAGKGYRVTWEEERDWKTAAATDQLVVGVLYADHPLGPRLAREVSGVRGELCGTFMLDETMGQEAYVYCFFRCEDGTAFSESFFYHLT